MTTIAQLPPATTVGAGDLLPLSQDGLLYSVTVAELSGTLQPLINVATGDLLGRVSTGAGGPEAVSVGSGLKLANGALAADGADHASFPLQSTLSLSNDLVISNGGTAALLPVTALRGLFSAGSSLAIDPNGVISVTASSVAGPPGPPGPAGAAGPAGLAGAMGPAGAGLTSPGAANSTSAVGASDYVALWQNGAIAWMPYGQFLGGQSIDELPAAGPAADSDEFLVAQGSSSLCMQGFGAIWTYVQNKLPSFKPTVIEITANTVLDATEHNGRILVASSALTLTANYANMGAGFSCTLINLAAGSVTMGTGITSGSGTTTLPPGASAMLLGLSYSGGSLVWWSGVTPNAPTITVGTITAPALNAAFTIGGGIFNDAPSAFDYSVDNGTTWLAAPSPVVSANAYSFTAAGLTAGTYVLRVRDHANTAVVGVSNSFTISQPTISFGSIATAVAQNAPFNVSGSVTPGSAAVRVGLSSSTTVAPSSWQAASVSGGKWTVSLTPATVGSFHLWAEQTATPSVQAVSAAITVVAASLTVTAPAAGTANASLNISGSVTPTADAVNVQLATQNGALPTSGWTAATNASGTLSANLTPSAAGTYYVWAEDAATGLTAVSSAIAVAAAPTVTFGFNNPGGTYSAGVSTVPLNGAISPPQSVSVQVALSISGTTVPSTGWQAASVIYSNGLWAIYYTTPAAAGSYYVWVETTSGGSQAVSGFTVSVT